LPKEQRLTLRKEIIVKALNREDELKISGTMINAIILILRHLYQFRQTNYRDDPHKKSGATAEWK
jgi:hypothetical protein